MASEPLYRTMEIRDRSGRVVGSKQVALYKGLLAKAHEDGLTKITTSLTQVPTDENGRTAIATAEVVTAKGTFEGIGDDREAAELAAGRVVLAALRDEFMKRTHARSAAANARYDELTEHGQSRRLTRRVRPDTAVAIALQDERRQHAPSTH